MNSGYYLVIITESIYPSLKVGNICLVNSYDVCFNNLSVKKFSGQWIQELNALSWKPITKTKLLELIIGLR